MKSRRSFLKSIGNLVALASLPMTTSLAATNSRIIIVGGGVAGTRAAAYLKMSLPNAWVSLIDPAVEKANDAQFYAIQNQYKPVGKDVLDELGVEVLADHVRRVDPAEKNIYLQSGKTLSADFLVMAPGVDFKWDAISKLVDGDETQLLHAWSHPSNELGLWKAIEAMQDGESVVISVPKMPYQFPQGPYQRATRVAHYLKSFKSRSRVLLLDHNDVFPAMHTQLKQWDEKFGPGTVEWVNAEQGGEVKKIDLASNTIYTRGDRIKAGVMNIIPPQQAGLVAREAGLNVQSDWCQVIPNTMESTHYRNVYVIGDANNADLYHKTAAVAEQHALQCVNAIRAMIG